jgi:hypothetical protein
MKPKTADVAGLRLFYREARDPSKPTIVLLHGFPSSSYQFHDLIPRLADGHVLAPDYPGMGSAKRRPRPSCDRPSIAWPRSSTRSSPSCARAADLVLADIGGPIGMRIACPPRADRRPDFQNFTISVEVGTPNAESLTARQPETEAGRTEQFATVERTCFSTRRARANDALNPDNWAIDAMRSRSQRVGSLCRGCL